MKKWLLYWAGLVGVAVVGSVILFFLYPQATSLFKIFTGSVLGFVYSLFALKKLNL